jgi:hypothetical protein
VIDTAGHDGDVNPEPPPGYLPYPPPPPPPPTDPRRRRLVVGLVTGWVLVLLVGAVWYALDGRPTIPEQTTVEQAQATVDRAVGLVVTAARPVAVPAISGYDQVESCDITPVRGGVRYDRQAWLATPPGSESALLDRIARELPAGYRPAVFKPSAPEKARLTADAGDYVAVTGTVDRPGLVLVSAATGCRPLGRRPVGDPSGSPGPTDRAQLDRALAAFGIAPVRWSTHRLPCGLTTIEADGAARAAGPLPTPSPNPTQPPSLVHRADVYAQAPGLLVRVDGDHAVATLTTGACA